MFPLALDPIAFSIGALRVHWYGLILGFGALVGLYLVIREGKRFGIPQEFFMDMLLLGVPSAIIGARIYFVAFKWDEYRNNLLDVFKIWNGGIAIYGALISAIICGIIYFRYKGYPFWRIADICAPSLLAGQMIGRWGNFVNQEAYGGPVHETFLRNNLHLPDFIVNQMYIEANQAYHHPTFLYESIWSLVGIVLLMVLRRQRFMRAGELFLSYFIWYSIGRFFIEGLRTDSLAFKGGSGLASFINGLWSPMKGLGFEQGYLDPNYGNIRISQLLSLLIIVAAVLLIIIRRTTGAAKDQYSDPIESSKTHAVDPVVTEQPGTPEQNAPVPPSDLNHPPLEENKKE
ncbi:phosphatidylglycerol:prolipoprotein diacylglycerol transferase [Paenibacillus sophorae]|uniref:Phosphatidylglycerol--prolipoprotein diacylglyceryl transferase n=1 Tax=Paenibacillus sophorae TaxID=1333845 RepID=A0A1H8P1U4_9BACL|nr:prolipoprotein diacylglyceryl transferase [Paenibacillus sophorae]QWU16409.1 prolipoprotein diacylglyceryl transferase [Paenibacillus sophorae]SEO35890.1 phosphatidylglycerol:prolipoprotein diacylglycerol transferase [Paenibacillus sophorae]